MKKQLPISVYMLLCLSAMMISCNMMDKKEIETSVVGYLEAMISDNFGEAYKYSDNDTKELVSVMEQIYNISDTDNNMSYADTLSTAKEKKVDVTIIDINITSDTSAKVSYLAHLNNEFIDSNVLEMRKVNNQWLVHQSKESSTSELFGNL